MLGCNTSTEEISITPKSAVADNVSDNQSHLSDPYAENPKLDSALVQLIQAQKRGEAESFAASGDLKLKDGKVFVTFWPASGQGEVAANAVIDAGGELTSDYSEKMVDAWVPITRLETLAHGNCITRIERANPGDSAH
jgi:hypothetical protein